MRATGHDHKGHNRGAPIGVVVLAHDERALRRKLITLEDGREVLVDLANTIAFETGDVLVLEDGRPIEVVAANEELYEIRGRDAGHLAQLIWHIGNRHLPCQVEFSDARTARALIGRDHVIRGMLENLGATVTEIVTPFSPLRGAYGDQHGHHHHTHDGHGHTHE